MGTTNESLTSSGSRANCGLYTASKGCGALNPVLDTCNLEGPTAGKARDEHLLTLPLPIFPPLGTPAQDAQISHYLRDLYNHSSQEVVTGDEDTS